MSIELKPCPFCGSKRAQISSDGGCKHFRVFCPECGALVGNSLWGKESEIAAISAWNNRAPANLDQCAMAIEALFDEAKDDPVAGIDEVKIARTVLEAAGVDYED